MARTPQRSGPPSAAVVVGGALAVLGAILLLQWFFNWVVSWIRLIVLVVVLVAIGYAVVARKGTR